MSLTSSTVVLDLGSETSRVGLGGQLSPCMFRSVVGKLWFKGVMVGIDDPGDIFVGDEAIQRRGILRMKYPVQCGLIEHWDAWQQLAKGAIQIALGKKARCTEDIPSDLSVLVAESPLIRPLLRERIAQELFEHLNVKQMYSVSSSVLSLYHYGFTDGIVLDSGVNVTTVVPIWHHHSIQAAKKSIDIGGDDLNGYMKKLLSEDGTYSFSDSAADMEIVSHLKKTLCYVSGLKPSEMMIEEERGKRDSVMMSDFVEYELPDGRVIQVSDENQRQCAEAIFQVSLLLNKKKNEEPLTMTSIKNGITELVWDAIQQSDLSSEMRLQMSRHICLAGGNTCFNGLSHRLENELIQMNSLCSSSSLSSLSLSSSKTGVLLSDFKVHQSEESINAAWLGGSILSELSMFEKMVVRKEDYDEVGPSVVHLKCF